MLDTKTMSMIGNRVIRTEDPDFLTVGGMYVADVGPSDALHITFVRSLMAHAKILAIDTAEAMDMPGVVGIFTASDLALEAKPPGLPMLNQEMLRTWLASDRVRFVGELVAAVVTKTREQGVDAAEVVFVDYEPLDAVVDIRESIKDDLLLFPDASTNIAWHVPSPDEQDMFAECEVTVDLAMRNPRMSVAPMEPRSAVSHWAADENGQVRLTQWSCTQFPHRTRDDMAAGMGVDATDVHVITPDVGGGFGGKNGLYPEDMVTAAVARAVDRPVRWTETRSESMLGLAHARSLYYELTIGGDRDGRVKAYRIKMIQDGGAYPNIGCLLPMFTRIMALGVYDIEKFDFESTSVVTNTSPTGAYRGAGRPEATTPLERMMDAFAMEIEMDPAAVRRINFIPPDAFPMTTQTGADMDSGEYAKAMDAVIEAADYVGLRAEQARRRTDPSAKLLGLGWSTYVEITNPMSAPEFGSIEIKTDGSAVVLTGSSSHGQGHHTAFAQLAADITGIPFDKIVVRHGDTDEVPRGGGTGGSRSLQVGGTAVYEASEMVVDQARKAAADLLEANPADIVLNIETGGFAVTGSPSISKTWSEVAGHLEATTGDVLKAETDFQPTGATFPFGAHLSVVEIDRDTGEVSVLRHISCDDAGTIINPLIFDGQVHGGVASGIAHTLMEEFVYDDDGNPLTSNFMDYAFMSAAEFPSFERTALETPTDRNPLGAKGIGEAGTIGAGPAVHNAVVDALSHLGIRHIEMPTTPQRVWNAMSAAEVN